MIAAQMVLFISIMLTLVALTIIICQTIIQVTALKSQGLGGDYYGDTNNAICYNTKYLLSSGGDTKDEAPRKWKVAGFH